MSFPRYQSYKDSGVEWLGEVPGHWDLPKLKHFTRFFGGGTPSRDNLQYWNGDIPWVSPKDMKTETIDSSEEAITASGLENSSSSLIPSDRLLMVVRSGILKHTLPVAINEVPVALNQDMKALDFNREQCNAKFFLRWVQGLNDLLLLAWAKQGATVESIEHAYLAETIVPLPSIGEQQTIAAFLDRGTAKIDALIAEQQRLIELLKEKRQAVISHAVTKGLNPDAPMKDSGIEWLGEVPEHWDILPIKRVASICYGIGEPPQYQSEGTPLIRATNVHNGQLFEDGLVFVNPSDIPERRIVWLSAGDIIVVRSGAYTGDSAIIPENYGPCIAGFDMVLRCNAAPPRFVQYALLSKYLKEGQIDLEKMRAAQPHLNAEELGGSIIVLPSSNKEQTEIVSFLDLETAKLDTLTAEAQRAITLLQERRTALISAAVTGKIDVRGLVLSDR